MGAGTGWRRGATVFATAALLAAGLVACGDDDGGAEGGAQGKDASSVKLAMITASTTQNPFQQMAAGAEEAAKQAGVDLTSQAPNGIDPTAEVQMFQAATRTAKDGVGYETVAPDVFTAPAKRAVDDGIPLVSVDAAPLPGSGVTAFVGNDNVELGRSVAREIIKDIPEDAKGEVVVGNNIPALPLLQARVAGMIEVLKAERPNVKIVGPVNSGAEPADNYNRWSALVKAHPDALAYLEPGAQGAVSFKQISQQTGKHYLMGGCDVDPTALQAVKDGDVRVLGDPHHWVKGYLAIKLLADHAIDGKALPEGWWNSGSGVVTPDNIDEVMAREKDNASKYAFFEDEIKDQLANPPVKPIDQAK